MLEPELREYPSDRKVTRAVERCIYDLDRISHFFDDLGMNDLLLKLDHVFVIDLLADHIVQMIRDSLFLCHRLHFVIIRDRKNLIDYIRISRRCDLCAVFPVNLVSVILGRIVTGRDYYTCRTSECSYRK